MELDDDGVPKALHALHADRLVKWKGQHYIADSNIRSWYDDAYVGMIVAVAGKRGPIHFELESRFVHSNGAQHLVAWWVRRVVDEGWVPDAIPQEA